MLTAVEAFPPIHSVQMSSTAVANLFLPVCKPRYNRSDLTPKARPSIEGLPDVVLGNIFNCLHWRDKIRLLEAFPGVFRVVNSPLGWRTFQAGERRSVENQQEELACVHEYGHLFQHCTLWLGRPCRNSWECTCLFDDLVMDNVFPVLEALVDNCQMMKSLRLYHPSHVTPQSCDTKIFKQYQQAIERLLLYAMQKNHFSLELCGLQYSHDHIRPISLRFLDYYISNPQVLQLVRVLDITRITDSRLQSPVPLTFLKSMVSLTTLKVPIHCITMAIVQSMVHNLLQDLYLLSDDCTVDNDYLEKHYLHWDHLLLPGNSSFCVHYIFKQRILSADDFTPNPYVKSLCFDSLCKPLTEDLVMAVADRYGSSLQLFGITHSMWQPELRISDLSEFASKCGRLTHFLSTVVLPGAVLISLVQNSPRLKHVLVVAQGMGALADIVPSMSHCLNQDWRPHDSPSTFHVDICELSFLMEEFTLRGYG